MAGAPWRTRLLILGAFGIYGCAGNDVDYSNEVESHDATVIHELHHDTSPPLWSIPPAARSNTDQEAEPVKRLPRPTPRPGDARRQVDPVVLQSGPSRELAPTPLANFDGIGNGVGGFSVNSAPPDTNGDVGPNHYVQIVNSDIAVFNKATGALILGPEPSNTLWSGFGGLCQTDNDGDATVLYDPIADRWIVAQFAVTGTSTHFLQCVAVSTSPDPTGTWNRYSFDYGSSFPDYPKMGVWPDAYYQTFNLFNAAGTAFLGGRVCAYDRAKMLAGQAATQICFNPQDAGSAAGGLLPADLDGARLPPAGSPNYVLALGNNANQLAFYRFHVDFATPGNSTLTGPTDISVAGFSEACGGGTCIQQSSTTQQLDSLADRLMFRLAYRNLGDHEALLATHAITSGSAAGVRWYELRVSGSNPSLFQQGTFVAPGTGTFAWMSSAAMDQAGNIAIGYSTSSSSLHPGVHFTGRLAGDAAGTISQGDNVIIDGAGSQTGGLSRWGDYSGMVVDPSDDCTFYYTNEYIPANGSFNWKTRVGSFKLPGCGGVVTNDFSISANPTTVSVVQGGSGSTTIATAVTSGSAQSVALSVSGLPVGASASFNPTSVTAGGSSTLTLNSGTAAAGTYNLTVTGTGTSATHSTAVSFVVTPPVANDFSISANPSSLSIAQGGSGATTIATAVTSGSAQSVSLSASGLPAGATASFNPTSVTAGGSSTLTINVGASTPAGTSTITVTGTGTSATHSTTVSLTVTTAGGTGIVNGGFETGTLSGWTSVGTTGISTSPNVHSGSFAARVGSTAVTNGDSSIAQTFTVPAGGGTLSFFYKVSCPDTVTFDWATATLRDNTAGTTSTILPKTCTNDNTWRQVTANLVGGHSVTLTLISHDDNFANPPDPTFTLYDDVTILAPITNPVTNPGFESGLSGWTAVGPTGTSTTAHSGVASARVGSTVPFAGDASISQTFTIPAGATRVTFFYQVHCTDTVTFDWATATLRDNTTGTTSTVLPKTCTNNNTWLQASGGAIAGHSVTLTLIDHDDNFTNPPDPTFTLYDDVGVQ